VALEVPEVGGGVGEAEELVGFELDVPFEVLPGIGGAPPVSGEGKGTVMLEDASAMGAAEQGEGVGVTALWEIEGDDDFDGWSEAGERGGAFGGVMSEQ